MNSVPVSHALILAGILFAIGGAGLMTRRNLVVTLMSVELMLNSTGIAFVAAASKWGQPDGQVAVIFILVTAAAEVAVGLSLLLRINRKTGSVDSDKLDHLRG